MNKEKSNTINQTNAIKAYIRTIKDQIIDKQARNLIKNLKWRELEGISKNKSSLEGSVLLDQKTR